MLKSEARQKQKDWTGLGSGELTHQNYRHIFLLLFLMRELGNLRRIISL